MYVFIVNQLNLKDISDDELSHAIQVFEIFDTNKSGFIEFSELKKALELTLRTPMSPKLFDIYVKGQFANIDKNSDGKIQFKEFIAVFDKIKHSEEIQKINRDPSVFFY